MPTAMPAALLPGHHTTAPPGGGAAPRRAPIRIIVGLLVTTLGFVVGAIVLSRVNHVIDVLVTVRAVPAGAVLTDDDLTTTSIATATTVDVIVAARRAEILGRTAALPLARGTLLIPDHVGHSLDPATGQTHLAIPVPAGRTPAGLTPGAAVTVLVLAADPDQGRSTPTQAPAVVRHLEPPDSAGVTVITVQMASDAAVRIASSSGDVIVLAQGR